MMSPIVLARALRDDVGPFPNCSRWIKDLPGCSILHEQRKWVPQTSRQILPRYQVLYEVPSHSCGQPRSSL